MASSSTLITTTRVLTPLILPASSATNPAPSVQVDSLLSATPNALLSSLTTTTIMSNPSSTPIPIPEPPVGGLSTGAKAGIAVLCALLFVLLLSVCICLHISYRNKRANPYGRNDKTFQATHLSQIQFPFQNTFHQAPVPEGRDPLLRDGSYMDLSTRSASSAQGSPNMNSAVAYSPGGIEALSPPGRGQFAPYNRPHSNSVNSFLSPSFLSATSPNFESQLEKERWRESHSIAGYFDSSSQAQAEAEPRLSTGDKMVAEWRRNEIETAREKSMERSRSREPHPMADYQVALPPFFPKGFKDINGEEQAKRRSVQAQQRAAKREESDRLLGGEGVVHEMDVGDAPRGRGHDR